jgi:hypothetical protein
MPDRADHPAAFQPDRPHVARVTDWRPGPPAIRDHPVLEMACAGVARKP